MTERCQTKFTENFDNKNYIIYVGILCTSFAVLYFYRFHFAIIAFSYVLGCLACYYGLNSNILRNYVYKLKCHFFGDASEDVQDIPVKGCVTCGSKECNRHDSSSYTEPWVGLQIHKQLDQAIEDFYNTILDQFINSWYSKISQQPFFVDELRHQIRYASACLLQRALKINYSRLITERLLPCALRHYTLCVNPSTEHRFNIHPAAANRTAELQYLRCVTNAIMPHLLRKQEVDNAVFRVLIREIFAGWVLLSLTDVLADPYILNTLILLATGDETMAELPTTPNYKVEFLETFARQTESVYSRRARSLRVELELVLSDQHQLYAFMQHAKAACHLHLLQFYNDIKSFQIKILNPELTEAEKAELHREACDIYKLYISEESASRVPLQQQIADELHHLLQGEDSIKRLQTSRALYQAARQTHAVLEKIMLPRFLHSEEFYKLLIGSRVPTGYQKNLAKKPQERLMHSALKLGNKLRGALKSTTIDGQVLDCFANIDDTEADGVDNVDILKYLDSLAADESLQGEDLSNYKVVLTNVETRLQPPPRRGPVRVFTIAVHVQLCGGRGARLCTLQRTEHDFHLLRSKLHEFHGDALLHDLPLPSRRDNSPLETLRYKYEDFLQRLLQKSLLQTSELLRIFLTEDGDFSMVVQAATLNATSTDLVNIYQSVTHKLRKEKGQHLESFLKNLLVSSDMDRYQALKHGTTREVEEAQEMSEEIHVEQVQLRKQRVRNILATKFQNNFDVQPTLDVRDTQYQDSVVGFTQCLMYLLIKVLNTRPFVFGVIGSILGPMRDLIDDAFNKYLNSKLCELLSERRLAHLIRLGQGVLFGNKSGPRASAPAQRESARRALAHCAAARRLAAHAPLQQAFEVIQAPRLNKQLVYNLLDLCIVELFPELRGTEASSSREPKS